MVQNHLLQLLALVAMEPPARIDSTAVRDAKVTVLRSLRPMNESSVLTHSVKGPYGPGAVQGQIVDGYDDELGRASGHETFAAIKTFVGTWPEKGVPFYYLTGKQLTHQ